MKSSILTCLVCLALPLAAYATPYISPEEAMRLPRRESVVLRAAPREPLDYEYDPLNRFRMCADFITTLQVSDTASADYGGMREGEHMLSVIQTDNTSESIWVWTHYYNLTGNDDYHDNVEAAWDYCMTYPAYNEEGQTHDVFGYYRVYNCAWALQAEMEYRQTYGDTSYVAYAESCASYLCHNPLRLYCNVRFYRRVNGMVMSWAIGSLYRYGEFVGNANYTSKAAAIADSIKPWAEQLPNRFNMDEWAMNGGAIMWGLVNSYFKTYPAGLEAWVDTCAPYLDTEVESGDYQNAWRAWSALGHDTAADVVDSVYDDYFQHLADTLVANDGDSDGGIPVIDGESDDHDQSWVTNYLAFMCMDRQIDPAGIASPKAHADVIEVSLSAMPSSGLPRLNFRLAEPSHIRIRVYDVMGRQMFSKDAGMLAEGLHSVPLSGGTQAAAASGIYFYALDTGRKVANGKIVVLK
jgi:hypothetical protein